MSAPMARKIAALAPRQRDELLRRMQAAARPCGDAVPALEPDPAHLFEPFPLTEIQQIYLAGGSGLFELGACGGNVYLEYELATAGGWLAAHLEQAVARLVERHPVLRCVVLPDGRQQILPAAPPCRIAVTDLRGRTPAEVEAALVVVRERLRYSKAPIDRWPLFEFQVHGLDDERSLLHVRLSALLADGRSRQLLMGDLLHILAGGEFSALPEISYRDYALARAALGDSAVGRRARAHWLDRLASLPPAPELPLARPITPETPSRFELRYRDLLTPAEWGRLKVRAGGCGATPSLVVLGAYADVLARWAAQPRFTLAIEATDYFPSHPKLQDVVGNFNTVHLLAVDPSGGFTERLRRLQESLVSTLEHRSFSGLAVMRELKRLRGGHERALFPVFFNSVIEYSHPAYLRAGAAGELRGREVEATLYLPQVLLLLTVNETHAGGLSCKCQSVDAAFVDGLVDEMLEDLRLHLHGLAVDDASWHCLLGPPSRAASAAAKAAAAPPPETASARRTAPPPGALTVVPAGDIELRLAALWTELLGTAPASATDDFFSLGGDSFRVVRLLDRIRRDFGRDLPGPSFFADPTIAGLARLLGGVPSVLAGRHPSQVPQGDRR